MLDLNVRKSTRKINYKALRALLTWNTCSQNVAQVTSGEYLTQINITIKVVTSGFHGLFRTLQSGGPLDLTLFWLCGREATPRSNSGICDQTTMKLGRISYDVISDCEIVAKTK